MNRERREDETFEDYRKNLKVEDVELKKKLKRRIVWTSCIIMPDPKEKDLPVYLRRLIKLSVRGTFDRSQGHSMPNSLHEKQRTERAAKRMRKWRERHGIQAV